MGRYPKRAEHMAYRIIDNEAVIVSPMESEVTILNEVGAFIWKIIDGSQDTAQIAKELCREYGVSEEEAKRDIEEFIEDLMNKGLVVSNQ